MVKRYIHKPVEGREPTSEILKRLKEQESRTKAKLESFSMGRKRF